MIYIIAGTNRPQSKTLDICKILESKYKALNQPVEIIDLNHLPINELSGETYQGEKPSKINEAIDKLTAAEGWVIVCPEYNGSYPGVLKYFVDHFKYPDTFEYRPVAFVGLGWAFGGLRPVEHLQGIFGYRNAFMYPKRVFVQNIGKIIVDGKCTDAKIDGQFDMQTSGFIKFIKALKSEGLDANSLLTQ